MRVLGLLLLWLSQNCGAHPLDLGLLRFEVGNPNLLQLDLNQTLVAQLLGFQQMSADELIANTERAYQTILAATELKVGETNCSLENPKVENVGQSVRVAANAVCPGQMVGELSIKLPFVRLKEIPKTFEILAVVHSSTNEQVVTLKGGNDLLKVNLNENKGLFEFVVLGLDHIGVTPSEWKGSDGFHFPEGIDHILFIIALIIVGGGIIELVKTATGFTVGHSITLGLASFQWVNLNSKWVESIIALSIAYVAFESAIRKEPKHRWRVAGLFGLIHGFGFATVLGDLNLKGWDLLKGLIGFNLGIELGQVAIVLVFIPILMLLEKTPTFKPYFVKIVSIVIGGFASYWFYLRTFV